MRDLVNQNELAVSKLSYYGAVLDQSVNYTYHVAGRSGVQQGTYVNGFVRPTTYGAFKGSVVPADYDYGPDGDYENHRAYGRSTPQDDYQGVFFGMQGTYPSLEPQITYSHSAKARQEAVEKLANSDVNLGIALAEGRQTYRLVVESTLSVLRAYRSVRNGNIPLALQHLKVNPLKVPLHQFTGKTASAAWLQLSFGWLPLLSDIKGLIDTSVKDWNFKSPTLSVVRRVKRSYPLLEGTPADLVSSGSSSGLVEVKLYYTIDDPTMLVLNSLGLINPLSIGWELVPFSFVLDWFIPVGTYIRNLSGYAGIKYIGGYELHRRETDMLTSYDRYEFGSTVGVRPSYRVVNKCWKRYALLTPPKPQLYVDLGFSNRRAITALALIEQQKRYT